MAMARITRVLHMHNRQKTVAELQKCGHYRGQLSNLLYDLWTCGLVGSCRHPFHTCSCSSPCRSDSCRKSSCDAMVAWLSTSWRWLSGILSCRAAMRGQAQVSAVRGLLWAACSVPLFRPVNRFLAFLGKNTFKSPFFQWSSSKADLERLVLEILHYRKWKGDAGRICLLHISVVLVSCRVISCRVIRRIRSFIHGFGIFVCGIGWQADASGYVSYVASNLLRFSRSIRSRTPRGLRPTLGSSGSILLNHCLQAHLRLEENYNVTGLTCAVPNVVNSIDSKCMQMPTGTGLDYTGRDSQVSGFVSQ